jgi:serine/threonine protein kinase
VPFSVKVTRYDKPSETRPLARLVLEPVATQRLPSDLAELRAAICAVLRALQAFHQLGCVHRDVRWPNVLVDGRGNWLLVDFELADVADQPLPADAIAFDAVAPEARPLGAPYTPADDVWQVGRLIRSAGLHLPSEAESLAAQLMAPREARLSTQAALAHPWLHDS